MCVVVCAVPRRAAPRTFHAVRTRVHAAPCCAVHGPCVMRAGMRVRVQVLKEFLKGADDAAIAKLPKAEQVPLHNGNGTAWHGTARHTHPPGMHHGTFDRMFVGIFDGMFVE